jgi:hypothetical protein
MLLQPNGGNVGIGTTAPGASLDILGTSLNLLRLGRSGYDTYTFRSSIGTGLELYNTTDLRSEMFFDGNGNVGIGTTSPNTKLSVATVWSNGTDTPFISSQVDSETLNRIGTHVESTSTAATAMTFYTHPANNASSEKMRITSAGNVGIGTTTPGTRLDVLGGTANSAIAQFSGAVSGRGLKISTFSTGTTDAGVILDAQTTSQANLAFATNGSEAMRITNAGNVGIGTTSPSQKLTVRHGNIGLESNSYGNTGLIQMFGTDGLEKFQQGLTTGGDAYLYTFSGNNLILYTNNGSERMRITSGGNVGIGTTSPQSKLQIGDSYIATSGTNKIISLNAGGYYSTSNGSQYNVIGLTATTIDNSDIYTQNSGESVKNFYLGLVSEYAYFNVNRFSIFQGGAERLTIQGYGDNAGFVGIGTTTPTGNLEIFNNNIGGNLRLSRDAGAQRGVLEWGRNNGGSFQSIASIIAESDLTSPNNGLLRFILSNSSGTQVDRMRLDASGNLGLGVTPSAWGSVNKVFETTLGTSLIGRADFSAFGRNFFYNSSDAAIYTNNGNATGYFQTAGQHIWVNAPSGTAGNAISFTQAMTLNASGNLGIGTTSPTYPLDVYNTGASTARIRVVGTSNFALLQAQNTSGTFYIGIDDSAGSGFAQGNYTRVIYSSESYPLAISVNNAERMRITSSGNVGIGTTFPNAKLDVNGDALINGLTIGRGGANIGSNTALGLGTLYSNTTGEYNIAVGANANTSNNISGSTVIGVDLFTSPGNSSLTSNCLAISQHNPSNSGTQYPHIYAPDKINCPNGDTTTDVLAIDYSVYTAVFMEYSIFNSAGDEFRAGTYTVAFKGTGTPVDDDKQTVVYSGTTLLATFNVSLSLAGSIATIRLRNQDSDTYDIRVTARLLMR